MVHLFRPYMIANFEKLIQEAGHRIPESLGHSWHVHERALAEDIIRDFFNHEGVLVRVSIAIYTNLESNQKKQKAFFHFLVSCYLTKLLIFCGFETTPSLQLNFIIPTFVIRIV